MDESSRKIHIANDELPTGFDLNDILAEYRDAPAEEPKPEPLTDRSRRIVMQALDDAIDSENLEAVDGIVADTVAEAHIEEPEPEPEPEPEIGETALSAEEEAVIAALIGEAVEAELSEMQLQELTDADERETYAAAAAAEEPGEAEGAPAGKRGKSGVSAKERFLSPLIALMALVALRRERRVKGDRQNPTVDEAEDAAIPEMEPDKAVKLYGAQLRSLRLRGRIAAALSVVMLYLSFAYYSPALPLTGALHSGIRVISLLLIVMEISVIMAGLDVFTAGLLGIPRKRMGAETLAAVSCVLSLLDAAVLAAAGQEAYGLPFCAVSAISLTCAVWGAYYSCKGCRSGFRVLTASKNLYTVTGESGITPTEVALLKSRQSVSGFISRSEEADAGEYIYGALTPFLLIAAVVMGVLASMARGRPGSVLHCISVLSAASAAFSGALCFSVPFAVAARKLSQSGAAIAGWSGVRDIGKSRHVVITDSDVFPKGTVEISNIRILEGSFTDKVISYTGSVIAASGSGLAAPFADLIRRNGYSISRVENFEPHDGGGMTAMVNGENVYVGNTGFMNLMGIRLPQKLSTRSSLFTAINGALVGIFTVEYKPVSSVQEALVQLLHSNLQPIFAIRDFNITPLMIKKKFRMPTDSFKFPAYSERYRISGAEPDRSSRVAAVLAREGMGPLVEASERGRRVYLGVRAAAVISAVGSVFGLVMMFLLCWTGAFDSATVSNVITFMLLWLLPLAVIVLGLER